MSENEKALLPAGFHDVLAPDTETHAQVLHQLMSCFARHGYCRVAPPLLEFETSLLSGSGKSLKQRTFRVMDPASHRMMGLRADMTVQVARIAASRFAHRPLPLRLCYSGDVVRVSPGDLYGERQLTQAGIELFGSTHPQAEVEVILVALSALSALGISGLTVDLTLPRAVDLLCAEWRIRGAKKAALLHALSHKDPEAIRALDLAEKECFAQLVSPLLSLACAQTLLAEYNAPESVRTLVWRVEHVLHHVRASYPDVTFTFDLFESQHFPYHSGMGFSIFSRTAKQELGRGGRYVFSGKSKKSARTSKRSKEVEMEAVGVTLYANALFRSVTPAPSASRVFVPFGTPFSQNAALHAQGYVTVPGLSKEENLHAKARESECGYVWEDGALSRTRTT